MEEIKILIVDDEDIIVSVLHDFFTDMGMKVSSATTGKAGLALLSTQQFHVVIADMRLPDMSGNELLEEALKTNNKPTYFIHTGSIDYILPESLKEAGITEENIIFKPIVDLTALYQLIINKVKQDTK